MAWQNVLFIVAAITVVMLCVFTTVIRRKLKEPAVAENKDSGGAAPVAEKKSAPLFSPRCVASTFSILHLLRLLPDRHRLPSYLQTERGFDGGAIGFASALVAVVGVPGRCSLAISRISSVTVKSKLFSGLRLSPRPC